MSRRPQEPMVGPVLRFTTWEHHADPSVEEPCIHDIVEQTVPQDDPRKARRIIMRRLGFMVDQYLRAEGLARITLELPR